MSEQNQSVFTKLCICFTLIVGSAIFLSTVTALTMEPKKTYATLYIDCDGDGNIDQRFNGIVDVDENDPSYVADVCLGEYVSDDPLFETNENVGGGFEFNPDEYEIYTEKEVGENL